jgi:hypothetical protein
MMGGGVLNPDGHVAPNEPDDIVRSSSDEISSVKSSTDQGPGKQLVGSVENRVHLTA